MVFFSSDIHLSHRNILTYSNRPFSSIEEMDKAIYTNFHSVIKEGDTLWLLGDISFDKDVTKNFIESFLRRNIEVNIVKGNHDKFTKAEFHALGCRVVENLCEVKWNKRKITLCHYLMGTYNHSHKNSWHLYGHTHIGMFVEPRLKQGKKLNVNVEFHNYFPWSYDEVEQYMNKAGDNWDYIPESRY